MHRTVTILEIHQRSRKSAADKLNMDFAFEMFFRFFVWGKRAKSIFDHAAILDDHKRISFLSLCVFVFRLQPEYFAFNHSFSFACLIERSRRTAANHWLTPTTRKSLSYLLITITHSTTGLNPVLPTCAFSVRCCTANWKAAMRRLSISVNMPPAA
jgi:hypothetical protein